jgi:hypothetical protein
MVEKNEMKRQGSLDDAKGTVCGLYATAGLSHQVQYLELLLEIS